LSSDDDEVAYPPEPDASVDQKVSVTDDVGDVGTTSAEALVPGPIRIDAPSDPKPHVANWAPTVAPSDGRGQKCLRLATRRSNLVHHANQVMTQVELPPCC
jgi:hypothetical protein